MPRFLNFKLTLTIFILILCFGFFVNNTHPDSAHDLKIEIHEKTINNFLKAYGTIEGKKTIETYFFKGRLSWVMDEIKVFFYPQKAIFQARAKVNINGFSYSPTLKGNLFVYYNAKSNRIIISPQKALIELYVKYQGKKIHLGYLNIARFLQFELDGPRGAQSGIRIRQPDGSYKNIYMQPSDVKIVFLEQRLIFYSNLLYQNEK